MRVAGYLLVDLHAEDYNPATANWRNRAGSSAPGTANINNGDFTSNNGPQTSWPSKAQLGSPGVTAVYFNARANSLAQHLESNNGFYPLTSFYGASDWSMEAWFYAGDYINSDGSNTLIQWGPRPGTTCNSAFMGVGPQPSWGGFGSWNCDTSYGPNPATSMEAVPGAGYRPTVNKWHHVAVTYTGSTGAGSAPPYRLVTYIDSVVNQQTDDFQLAIARQFNIFLGTYGQTNLDGWWGPDSVIGIGTLRMHDGALSAADVAYNYNAEYVKYHPTPTPTPTPTNTPSQTPSNTASPSGTQINSSSNTPSPSITATPSQTPTPSLGVKVATKLLVEVRRVRARACVSACA